VYMLAKSERYFYDNEAVKELNVSTSAGNRREFRGGGAYTNGHSFNNSMPKPNRTPGNSGEMSGRNLRNVWVINPQPSTLAHFAAWPEKLVEPMIKASTSERGCCANCGAAWRRVVERGEPSYWEQRKQHDYTGRKTEDRPNNNYMSISKGKANNSGVGYNSNITTGWQPSCTCHGHFEEVDDGEDWITEETGQRRTRRIYVSDEMICAECQGTGSSIAWVTHKDTQSDEQWQASAARHPCPVCKGSGGNVAPAPVPCTVLDPFAGSGTTLQVAVRLGRHAIGVDLSESYLADLVPVRMDEVSTEPKRLTGGTEDWSEFALFADVA
jgi:hypothetical protein